MNGRISALGRSKAIAKRTLAWAYGIALFMISTSCFGDMVRGTIPLSPWGDPAHIRIFGEQGAPFAIGVYIIFYSGAFTIPFILIEAEADHRLEPYRSDNRLNVRCRIRVGAFLIATACVLTLPFSLPVVVACARAIIVTTAYWEEDWNAWLLAVWVIFSFLLALTGVRTLQAASYDADRNRDRG